jgi:hypothetical protein
MASVHFRNIVELTAEESGHETGDLLALYADKKEEIRNRLDEFEATLEAVASAYDDDKNDGITHEIGMRVLSTTGENCKAIFNGGEEDPFEDDDQLYQQSMIAAAILDLLLETKIIELPAEEEDNSSDVGDESNESESE